MATIIDSLVLELGFDTQGMEQGRRRVEDTFKKTQESAQGAGRKIEDSAKSSGEYITRLRNNVLALFAAFTAGRGLKDFVGDVTSSNAALGRFAKTVDTSALDIASWRGAGRLLGISAGDIDSTFSNLSSQFQQFAITGDSTIVPWFRALGMSMSDADGKMRPINDMLLELSQKVQGMDPAKATAFMTNMGISPGMINLILQGPPAIQKLIDAQKKLAEAQARDAPAAAARQQAWERFKSTGETIGTMLLTTLTPALLALTAAGQAFATWGEQHPTLVGMAFSALTAVVLLLSAGIATTLVGGAITSAIAGFGALISIGKSLMLGLAILSETALPALSEAFLGVGLAMEATPIGWIITGIAAIAAAGYLLYKNWDAIAKWWKHLWGDMSDEADQGADKINGAAGRLNKDTPRGAPVGGRNVAEKATNLLKGFEGYTSTAKWDVNAYRAGYGSDTVTDPATGQVTRVTAGTTVTRAQADADLQRRLNSEFIPLVQKSIGQGWGKLSDDTKAAIVSVSYNYGKVPTSVAAAAQTGSAKAVSDAINGLKGHNGGINARRRGEEAQVALAGYPGAPANDNKLGVPNYTGQQLAAMTPSVANNSSSRVSTSSSETHIGKVEIVTQAKDADAMARDAAPALRRAAFAQQANGGPV